MRAARTVLALAFVVFAAGCASPKIPKPTVTVTDPDALSILTAAQRAQGESSFTTIRDLNVRFGSRWSSLGARSQPALWDRRHRRESETALDLGSGTSVQLHRGSGGRKFVLRAPGRVTVWYNGQPDSREEVLRAAALMADVEKMELLGALYFRTPGVVLEKLGTAKVNGRECDQVLAIVRPGFGYAAEDHVILSIDHETQRLHHASTTLHGFKRAGDARLEVTFRNWAQRNGVWWATDCDERIPGMMKIDARQVRLLDLKANHGFAPRHPELVGEAVSEASQLR